MNEKRTIEVVAAAIVQHGMVFATERGYGPWRGWWEFPGGKIEPGEPPTVALRRELQEELSLTVEVGQLIDTVEYDYPDFHLVMHLYFCTPAGEPHLLEHASARWLSASSLGSVKWLPADLQLLPRVASTLGTLGTL